MQTATGWDVNSLWAVCKVCTQLAYIHSKVSYICSQLAFIYPQLAYILWVRMPATLQASPSGVDVPGRRASADDVLSLPYT